MAIESGTLSGIAMASGIYSGKGICVESLTCVLGDQSKIALQASPDAAGLAQQIMGTQEGSGGVGGILKKVLGKQPVSGKQLNTFLSKSHLHSFHYPWYTP